MNSRLEYLDLSRFFAIIGVIAVHVGHASINNTIAGSLTELGRFGVQLFFVISGATVFLTYEHYQRTKENYLGVFYIKRFFRIVPLFVLMALYYSQKFNYNFISSILPWSGLNPYTYNNIEGGWSIWNEIYFYLIFPLYYMLRKKNGVIWLALTFSLISILINTRFFFGTDAELLKDFDYLNFFTQFICFVVGVEHFGKKNLNILVFFLIYFILGLISKLIFYPEFIFSADYGSLYWTALISISALYFVIAIKKILTKKNDDFLKKPIGVLSYFGQKTYTSYMIHFILIDILSVQLQQISFIVAFILITVCTFTLTILIENFTEKYWVKIGNQLIARLNLNKSK